ncbi:MAG: 30S ribosomal protein S6 [bacterium]|nr:30S ribosomal protein S6 [bacterium]
MEINKHIYETVVVLHPELSDEENETAVQDIVGLLESHGAEMLRVDHGGKRRLAYTMQKQRYGYYNLIHFRSTPAALEPLERMFRLSERIMRYLTVRFDKEEQLTGFTRLGDDDGRGDERDDRRRGGRRPEFSRQRTYTADSQPAAESAASDDAAAIAPAMTDEKDAEVAPQAPEGES